MESNQSEERTEEEWLNLLLKRNRLFNTKESEHAGVSFIPRPSDVFVVTYPKCGTTWMQQICHMLRTRGDMNFCEVTEVCPWDVLMVDCNQDLNADQVAHPRVIKSHESYTTIAKNPNTPAKYLLVVRDPFDTLFSFYNFMPNYFGIPRGKISIKTFVDAIFNGASNHGTIFEYYMTWYDAQKTLGDNLLWVFYEDLRDDIETQIRRVAKFMEIPLDDELLEIVKEKSSFAFMRENSSQFDDNFVFGHVKSRMGLDTVELEERIGKVRSGGGTTGAGDQNLPKETKEKLTNRWDEVITSRTGLVDYTAFKSYITEHYIVGT